MFEDVFLFLFFSACMFDEREKENVLDSQLVVWSLLMLHATNWTQLYKEFYLIYSPHRKQFYN